MPTHNFEARWIETTVASDWDGDFRSCRNVMSARFAARGPVTAFREAVAIREASNVTCVVVEIFRIVNGEVSRTSLADEEAARRRQFGRGRRRFS